MTVSRSGVSYADFSGADLNFVIRGKAGDCECSPECQQCYALAFLERFGHTPEQTTIYPDKLRRLRTAKFEEDGQPFRRGPGSKPILFPCDFGDLFHPLVPEEFIVEALQVMIERDDCDWLILTKRPSRVLDLQRKHFPDGFPAHLWAGTTAGTQKTLDERGPMLLDVRAAVHWLSIEPMLEPMDVSPYLACQWYAGEPKTYTNFIPPLVARPARLRARLSWLALGAESGANRRRFETSWAYPVWHECQLAGVAFFGKQDSGLRPGTPLLIEGREWHQFPSLKGQ